MIFKNSNDISYNEYKTKVNYKIFLGIDRVF